MNLESIIKLTAQDMIEVNEIIINQLNSDISLINRLGNYIINSGGKKIRPMIVILIGKALGYKRKQHINVAALIEFIHTATLLHDDVIDKSIMRRGKKTAHVVFGNAATVLVGDFIYTRSFQMMTDLNSMPILKLMAEATNVIAEGEVSQLINCNNPNITENTYMQIIYKKTARLFEAATHASAIISGVDEVYQQAVQKYGRCLGIAFQLIDDVVDYSINTFDKHIGNDLNTGKLTLPLLHVIQHGSEKESMFIRTTIKNGYGDNYLSEILLYMKRYGSLDYTRERANKEAKNAIKAIDFLPNSPYKDALISLVNISISKI